MQKRAYPISSYLDSTPILEKKKTFIQIIPEENNLGELRLELNLKTVRISGKSLASSSEMISFQLPKQMVSALWLKYVIASGQNI